jgi:DNA (cytosine-5)-methyltransferase 1
VDTSTVNTISICAGIGGIELGLRSVINSCTVCYVENELSVASILAARMEDGSLDPAPVWSDLTTFDPEPWRGKVDILAGGFPCQPFSVAGQQRGVNDERNLWPAVARLIRGLGLPTVFLENVPGILRYYWDTIRPELREMGCEVAEGLFTASETGAPHRRERLFILAHAAAEGLQGIRPRGSVNVNAGCNTVPLYPPGPNDREGWARMLTVMPEAQPTFCRVADGAPVGVDRRLGAVGNGVVPAVAAIAFRELAEQLSMMTLWQEAEGRAGCVIEPTGYLHRLPLSQAPRRKEARRWHAKRRVTY